MADIEVRIPDIGDFADVPVIEVHVAPGDPVAAEDPLVTLESDKATMDVPAPAAGTVAAVDVTVGDRVSEGTVIMRLAAAGEAGTPPKERVHEDGHPETGEPAGYGSASGVYDRIQVTVLRVGVGDRVSQGHPIVDLRTGPAEQAPPTPAPAARPPSSAAADLHAEVLVLGAGPGGYTAAFRAADLGKQVVLVDRWDTLGGVCLNVGCIPSKALLHAARLLAEAREMSAHGLAFGELRVDL